MVKNIVGARCTRPHRDIVAAPAQAVIPSVERGIVDAHTMKLIPCMPLNDSSLVPNGTLEPGIPFFILKFFILNSELRF